MANFIRLTGIDYAYNGGGDNSILTLIRSEPWGEAVSVVLQDINQFQTTPTVAVAGNRLNIPNPNDKFIIVADGQNTLSLTSGFIGGVPNVEVVWTEIEVDELSPEAIKFNLYEKIRPADGGAITTTLVTS